MHIHDLTTTLPVHPARRYRKRALARVDAVLLHHTAAPPEKRCDWASELARHAAYHIKHHGWPGIGYHCAIAPDGQCFKTNRLDTSSHHCPNWNLRGIGVVLLGDFTQHPPTPAALDTLAALLVELRAALPSLRLLKAHRECRATACPGAALTAAMLDALASKARLDRQRN